MATPSSGPISIADINSAFGLGYSLASYRGVTWYQPNSLNTGTFSSTNLSMSQFYNKQNTDPATSGSVTYNNSGSFTVPLYRNSFSVQVWGGGGGGGGPAVGFGGSDTSTNGGTSSISVAGYSLSAAGGVKGNIAPGDRSSGASGAGGVGSGGTTNGTGTSGTPYGAYGGRDRPGTSGNGYNGGAGGTTNGLSGGSSGTATGNPGGTPGGGGGPAYFDENVNDSGKSWSTGGASGGGGYASVSLTPSNGPSAGTVLTYTVGSGGAAGGQAGAGGAGQITITWT